MKQLALCLTMILAFCVSDAFAQKTNLTGTTWILKYTTGRANSNDYEEYARIVFLKGGKAEVRFSNTKETAKWILKGSF